MRSSFASFAVLAVALNSALAAPTPQNGGSATSGNSGPSNGGAIVYEPSVFLERDCERHFRGSVRDTR